MVNSCSAMGVTYSWEKRTSVRTKRASPGCTAGIPVSPVRASAMARLAMIFSHKVMGLDAVETEGGATFPFMRALL